MPLPSKPAPLPPWGVAVAGSTGAVLANAMVYPLDIVKTRLQVQVRSKKTHGVPVTVNDQHYNSVSDAITKIVKDEGIAGLYSGLSGSLLGVASTNFAYFYWYSVVRQAYTKYRGSQAPPSTPAELSLGAIAGALAQLFTIPVAVITTRQQTQPKGEKKGIFATGKEVIDSEDGWTGLWRGFKASLILVVNPSITYGAYQRLRDLLYPGRISLRPGEAFLLGAMSKALATVTTQPLIVAKVGLQSRPPPARDGKPFKTFGEVMAYIIEHEGYMGLFKGLGPQLLKGIIVQGLLMMTKERIELLFVFLFAYLRMVKEQQLKKAAAAVRERAMPIAEDAIEKVKEIAPITTK